MNALLNEIKISPEEVGIVVGRRSIRFAVSCQWTELRRLTGLEPSRQSRTLFPNPITNV